MLLSLSSGAVFPLSLVLLVPRRQINFVHHSIMFDVIELCADLSGIICDFTPLNTRVKRVLSSRDLELEVRKTTGDDQGFFDKNVTLSREERRKIFLRYKISEQPHLYVSLLVKALVDLVESGIVLTHDGDPVYNIVVLNNHCFDVSDLLGCYDITLHAKYDDNIHKISSMPTFESMLKMKVEGPAFCEAFGRLDPWFDREKLEKYCELDFSCTSVQHCWVGVVVKNKEKQPAMFKDSGDSRSRIKALLHDTYRMVHIDICGGAYDEKGFAQSSDGKIVSLLTFVTQNFDYYEHADMSQAHRFSLYPKIRADLKQDAEERSDYANNRHLKIVHGMKHLGVEILPLKAYTVLNEPHVVANTMMIKARWKSVVESYIDSLMLHLPAGTVVQGEKLTDQRHLNGVAGVVEKGPDRDSVYKETRLGVRFSCESEVSFLLGSFVRPVDRHRQILSYAEMLKDCCKTTGGRGPEETFKPVSKEIVDEIRGTLENDAVLKRAVLFFSEGGRFSFSSLADPANVSMVRRVIQKPFCHLLTDSEVRKMAIALEVFDHPRGVEVLKLFLLLQRSLFKTMQWDTERLDEVASIERNNSKALNAFERLLKKVVDRVDGDVVLSKLFETLDSNGALVHPKTLQRKVQSGSNALIY